MKAEEIHIEFEELQRDKEQNRKERLKFIDYWVEYIKQHKDEEWSAQQNVLIDGQMLKVEN